MQFPHEKLSVYRKSLACFEDIEQFTSSVSKQHAFVDHLSRAAESLLFNLVEAARLRQSRKKLLTMDYSIGSVFECAACLDIAVLKGLLKDGAGTERKKRLLEVCKMLIGLRNSWTTPRIAEEHADYSSERKGKMEPEVFHHESLDMYKVMLDVYRWFVSTQSGKNLTSAFSRSVDSLATCVVLNIAEGNGRYAELSRQTFLDTANAAALKMAVCLDMGARRAVWRVSDIQRGKSLLLRVAQMTANKGYAE